MITKIAAPALLLAVVGCTQISGNPLADARAALGSKFTADLVSASYNLDQAMLVGALDKTDPAPGCLRAALLDLGVGVELPSFKPKRDGLVSEGAILYIRAQQAKKLSGGIKLPADCKAIIGSIVLDVAAAGKDLVPGGGLIPALR